VPRPWEQKTFPGRAEGIDRQFSVSTEDPIVLVLLDNRKNQSSIQADQILGAKNNTLPELPVCRGYRFEAAESENMTPKSSDTRRVSTVDSLNSDNAVVDFDGSPYHNDKDNSSYSAPSSIDLPTSPPATTTPLPKSRGYKYLAPSAEEEECTPSGDLAQRAAFEQSASPNASKRSDAKQRSEGSPHDRPRPQQLTGGGGGGGGGDMFFTRRRSWQQKDGHHDRDPRILAATNNSWMELETSELES